MRSRTSTISRSPRLLVAVDFDGTLAPIVDRPELAEASPGVLDLLRRAAALPQTVVAVVSGRAIDDLASRAGRIPGVWLVGGHGAEVTGPHYNHRPRDVSDLLDEVAADLARLAPTSRGFLHERKSASIAVHYRGVEDARAGLAVVSIIDTVAAPAGLRVRHGKRVIELLALDVDKGRAIEQIRQASGATAVLYIGDDVTDEDAFRALGPHDLAVKVGEGPTEADLCVPGLPEAHELLRTLVDEREEWLRADAPPAIERHSVLSDQRTLAVVRPDGQVCWLCLPRIDGAAVFASLLDGENAGFWSVGPAGGGAPVSQRYLGDTFTLETRWPGMRTVDYLDGSAGRTFQRAGRTDLVRVLEGAGIARIVFAPRLDYGRARTRLVIREHGVEVEGAADPLVLYAPGIAWTIETHDGMERAVAQAPLGAGPVVLELRAGTRSLAASRVPEEQRRASTERVWSSWAASLQLPALEPDLCRRSALVLRSLVHGPTGALAAAATTSLPETAGGVRNWDYRFCWPRDAAVACASLVRLGNIGVAMKYLDWLLGVLDRCAGPERLRPIYTVAGYELGSEAELSHLSGYRASRPVRIGNAAAQQVQLDVFGPIVDLVYLLANSGAAISPDHWRLVEAMALAVERSWQEPDHGIWEVRTDKRHHVHSKAMCWLALDRAAKLADQFAGVRREQWEGLRDVIREDVLMSGFDPRLGAFVAAYDLHEPDAAALTLGLCGLIDPADPRFTGTIDLVRRTLLEGGTVYRYRYDDELAGPEGGFHLCTGWLISAMAISGRRDEAMELFRTLCAAAGPTGVMAEQWCPMERTGLGNLAQAYSHSAIIDAAVLLS